MAIEIINGIPIWLPFPGGATRYSDAGLAVTPYRAAAAPPIRELWPVRLGVFVYRRPDHGRLITEVAP